MYYISSKKGNLYGVTDTKDGVEEFYSVSDLSKIYKIHHLDIKGLEIIDGKIRISICSRSQDILSELEEKYCWFTRNNSYLEYQVKDGVYSFNRYSDGTIISDIRAELSIIDSVYKLYAKLVSNISDDLKLTIYLDENSVTLFLFDITENCTYADLVYSKNLNLYVIVSEDDESCTLKRFAELGIPNLKYGVLMSYELMEMNINNCKRSTVTDKISTSTNIELYSNIKDRYTVVEQTKGFYLPSGTTALSKAEVYSRFGCTICINDKVVDFATCKDIITNGIKSGGSGLSCTSKYYSFVSDYFDASKNIYYIHLGDIKVADFYC